MESIRKTTRDIEDLAILVIKSMFLIVVVVLIAKELLGILIGESLAKWASYILGIASLFVIIISKKVRQEIIKFGSKRK